MSSPRARRAGPWRRRAKAASPSRLELAGERSAEVALDQRRTERPQVIAPVARAVGRTEQARLGRQVVGRRRREEQLVGEAERQRRRPPGPCRAGGSNRSASPAIRPVGTVTIAATRRHRAACGLRPDARARMVDQGRRTSSRDRQVGEAAPRSAAVALARCASSRRCRGSGRNPDRDAVELDAVDVGPDRVEERIPPAARLEAAARRRGRRTAPRGDALVEATIAARRPAASAAGKLMPMCLPPRAAASVDAKPSSAATALQTFRSAECSQPQPISSGRPRPARVQARPPTRSRASTTRTESWPCRSRRAAAMPAAPAPITLLSTSCMRVHQNRKALAYTG